MEHQHLDEHPSTLAWQKRILPLMAGVIIVFSTIFIVGTAYQLFHIQSKIEYDDKGDVEVFTNMQEADTPLKMEQLNLKTKAQLETYSIKRRYHQSNMLLISRIWIQYLGFLVGMILAMVGGTFVLGKMRETGSSFDSDISSVGKFSFNSSSPGLFLVFFGAIIIITTLLYHPEIKVQDGSLYFDKTYQLNTNQNSNSEKEGAKALADKKNEDLKNNASDNEKKSEIKQKKIEIN
jgi:hypothetical protein